MTYAPSNILDVFKRVNDEINQTAAKPRGLSIKSCGTKSATLQETSTTTGYWADSSVGTSKPQRWIVQLMEDSPGNWSTKAPGSTMGYFNVSDNKTSIVILRILIAVKRQGSLLWEFPAGWECLLVLAFNEIVKSPSMSGGSSVTITDFNPNAMTVRSSGRTYQIAHAGVVCGPSPGSALADLSYGDAVAAIARFTRATLYDGRSEADIVALGKDIDAALTHVKPRSTSTSFEPLVLTASTSLDPFVLAPLTTLLGVNPIVYRQIEAAVNSGKRHIVFYGPPGTGKTTIAEYVAEELALWERGDGAYVMLTASTAWTAQDLVGGYQPMGQGRIGFIEGTLLREFDRPVVIDELNRAPIDKVLGPLFSVLSGQGSVLPYRVDVTDANSEFHKILPKAGGIMQSYEHVPGPAWHLLCTLNTYDKTQLGQISYALSRRFAWIEVPPPADLAAFVRDYLVALGDQPPAPGAPNPVAEMWNAVNLARPIGAAPIIDFIKTARALDPGISFFTQPGVASWEYLLAAFGMCVLPLMDGLAPQDMGRLAQAVSAAWALDSPHVKALEAACAQFAA